MFLPVGDASEQVLGLLAMAIANGSLIVDDEAKRAAGELAPFVRSGLLDETAMGSRGASTHAKASASLSCRGVTASARWISASALVSST